MQANWSQLTQQSKLKEEHCAVVIQAQWRGFVARKQLHAHKAKLSSLVGRQSRLAAKATKGLQESRSGSNSPAEDDGAQGELEVDTCNEWWGCEEWWTAIIADGASRVHALKPHACL